MKIFCLLQAFQATHAFFIIFKTFPSFFSRFQPHVYFSANFKFTCKQHSRPDQKYFQKKVFFFSKRMSEESEDVTPEQTDKIVSYSAATGNDDLDVCQSNLRVT